MSVYIVFVWSLSVMVLFCFHGTIFRQWNFCGNLYVRCIRWVLFIFYTECVALKYR